MDSRQRPTNMKTEDLRQLDTAFAAIGTKGAPLSKGLTSVLDR